LNKKLFVFLKIHKDHTWTPITRPTADYVLYWKW